MKRLFMVMIDAPNLRAHQGDEFPKYQQLNADTRVRAEKYVVDVILPKHTGSKITLLESVSVWTPTSHVQESTNDTED